MTTPFKAVYPDSHTIYYMSALISKSKHAEISTKLPKTHMHTYIHTQTRTHTKYFNSTLGVML